MCGYSRGGAVIMAEKAYTVKLGDVSRLLGKIAKEKYDVIVPTTQDGDVLYLPFKDGMGVVRDHGNPLTPPKEFFLPQTDELVNTRRKVRVSRQRSQRVRWIVSGYCLAYDHVMCTR